MIPHLTIRCVYFKPSGKFYSSAVARYDPKMFEDCTYPKQYGRRLREQCKLPGLQAGIWHGPFIISVHGATGEYPELVLPEGVDEI